MPKILDLPVFFDSNWPVFVIHLFISIPTYIICYLIFRKFISEKVKRTISIWISTIILTPIIYYGIIIAFFSLLFYEPTMNFDQQKWESNKNERYKMGDNLVKRKILIGKDSIAVKQLLGDANWKDSSNTSWTYDLGMGGGGLGFLFHNLSVKFSNNKVVKVEHIQFKD